MSKLKDAIEIIEQVRKCFPYKFDHKCHRTAWNKLNKKTQTEIILLYEKINLFLGLR